MKKTLSFTTHKEWAVHVANFENYTRGCGSWGKATFLEKKSPEEFHQAVLDLENINRTGYQASTHRDIVYCYLVTESEVMIDDRSKFGHENQSSEREISVVIPKTYVRGEVLTIAEALRKIETFENSLENERARLIEFIDDSPINAENPTKAELLQKIVKIPGEGKRETFFEFLDKYSILNVFPEEKLLSLAK